MKEELFEFHEAAPNRYIAHFYRECTVAEFIETILETKSKEHGRIVVFGPNRPLANCGYAYGKITDEFENAEANNKIICSAFAYGGCVSVDYALTVL